MSKYTNYRKLTTALRLAFKRSYHNKVSTTPTSEEPTNPLASLSIKELINILELIESQLGIEHVRIKRVMRRTDDKVNKTVPMQYIENPEPDWW